MAPSFGTSGLRGLVTELTPELVARYTHAFLAACPNGGALFVGRDLRPSSPRIAENVIEAALSAGLRVVDCGALSTPALALASLGAKASAIMITGSHIPADRNGLKFYVPSGEISKADEAAIVAAAENGSTLPMSKGTLEAAPQAAATYVERYAAAFGPAALGELRIGVYRHSSVARDEMEAALRALGAEVVSLAHSDTFIPVDTEAVDPATRSMLAQWCKEYGLDSVVSTDGDADRPMVTDAAGVVVPGDILGVLTALHLGATEICTPVSSNDMVNLVAGFDAVHMTRIGSPFVIAAMEEVLAHNPMAKVVGFEANGGFLLGYQAGMLAPLMTRDSLLPIIAPLVAAKATGKTLRETIGTLPPVFTAADRVQEIDREKAGALLAELIGSASARDDFFKSTGDIASLDLTDGLRVKTTKGEVVHLRPSGNAPEFRVYAQAATTARAEEIVAQYMRMLSERLG
ncbi:phosphomannomutase [Marivivens sp. LCG002]|uniref:phosphomannomutase n=1 Tax=Marivivens sp. LCG002 TaxID=3051171 RepID=UPI002556FD4A|nr:phosphomannomutase [Marivivens sp. LCG002]WIV50250.1 phosphomannomutase [Marivivens sp. LCG002]